MIINPKKLRDFMSQQRLKKAMLADKLGIHKQEVKKMLRGQAVGKRTATNFVLTLGAKLSESLIDWNAMGIESPL